MKSTPKTALSIFKKMVSSNLCAASERAVSIPDHRSSYPHPHAKIGEQVLGFEQLELGKTAFCASRWEAIWVAIFKWRDVDVLEIRKARPDELDSVFGLLYEAALWLRDNAINYWQVWLDPPELYKAWIRQGFENGEFCFVEDEEHKLAGMFRLQYEDELFWGKRNDKAGYIHSFTTNRELTGRRTGYTILRMIEQLLLEKRIRLLRLDCPPAIERLCRYYEDYGFELKKTVVVQNEELSLYEKRIKG